MDGGAWWAAVHGVTKSRTRLSDFTFTFHFHALEKEMATHSSVLAWRIPGTGEPGGLPTMGSHRVAHDWSGLAAAHCPGSHPKPDPVLSSLLHLVFFTLSEKLILKDWGSCLYLQDTGFREDRVTSVLDTEIWTFLAVWQIKGPSGILGPSHDVEAWLPPLPSPTSGGDLDKCLGFPGLLKGLIGGQHKAIWVSGPSRPHRAQALVSGLFLKNCDWVSLDCF